MQMKSMFISIIAFCFGTLFSCFAVNATSEDDDTNTVSDQHISTNQFNFNISFGVGVITNPLKGGKNFPLVLVPQVAYYGKSWFFDNGRLGYSFLETPNHYLNFVNELNPESRFFIDWHPRNIFTLQTSRLNNQFLMQLQAPSQRININKLRKRHIALDSGLSYHYLNDKHIFSLQALHDITGVYSGVRGAFQWQYHTEFFDFKVKPTLGINYKSAELNTYFYGLEQDESLFGKIDVGSSWQPYAKIDARLPLGGANSLRFHLAYYDYSAISDSPLFERNYSMTAFIGLDHTF